MKRRKVSACDKFWRTATSFDMFGERVQLNLDGKESFDTCCGAMCTIIVLAAIAFFTLFQIRHYETQWAEVPITSDYIKKGFFADPVEIRQDTNNFMFAIAVTAKQNFDSDTAQAFEESGGSLVLRYVISGGVDDGKIYTIPMNPCSDLSWV